MKVTRVGLYIINEIIDQNMGGLSIIARDVTTKFVPPTYILKLMLLSLDQFAKYTYGMDIATHMDVLITNDY